MCSFLLGIIAFLLEGEVASVVGSGEVMPDQQITTTFIQKNTLKQPMALQMSQAPLIGGWDVSLSGSPTRGFTR